MDGKRAPLVLEHELRVGRRVDDHEADGLGLVAVGHDVVGDDGELLEGLGDAGLQIPQVQEDVGRAVERHDEAVFPGNVKPAHAADAALRRRRRRRRRGRDGVGWNSQFCAVGGNLVYHVHCGGEDGDVECSVHTAASLRRELPKITKFGACFSRGVPANIAAVVSTVWWLSPEPVALGIRAITARPSYTVQAVRVDGVSALKTVLQLALLKFPQASVEAITPSIAVCWSCGEPA